MKYIFIIPLLLFASSANAATYWVDGSFQDLTSKQVNEKDAYISQIPDSVMLAKQSSACFSRYELVKERLTSFDKKNVNLRGPSLMESRDQFIADLDKKFVQTCLKKKNVQIKSKVKKDSEYQDLEARVTLIESQIQEIMKILQFVPGWQRTKG